MNKLTIFLSQFQELDEDLGKAEAEKTKKDHAIRGLNDEITSQEDSIQKLNKEKKFFQVCSMHIQEDRQ